MLLALGMPSLIDLPMGRLPIVLGRSLVASGLMLRGLTRKPLGGGGPRLDDVAVGNLFVELALRGLWVSLSERPVWFFDVLRVVAFEPEGGALDGAADKVLCPKHSVVVVPLVRSGVAGPLVSHLTMFLTSHPV